ncbi:MAG: hypothetical protein KDD62_08410 [Bdellovibrionales bacterium]|nr:hypothetical protein [Bdellovibrionales bacterium]
MSLRVANIPQLSCAPYKALDGLPFLRYEENELYHNLEKLERGFLDAAVVPAIDVIMNPNLLHLEFGMACRSRSDSMVIYANDALERLDTIHVYRASKSSAALVQLLFLKCYGHVPSVVRHEEGDPINFISKNEGVLSLHQLPGMLLSKYPIRKDVATWWYEVTKKPFVFLLWAVRRDALHHEALPKLYKWLMRLANIAEFLAQDIASQYGTSAEESKIFVADNRRYFLDDAMMEGLISFLLLAEHTKLLKGVRIRPAVTTPFKIEFARVVGGEQ